METPVFSISCIDYRFDAMMANFFEGIGLNFNYFSCSTAGASLCLGYKEYCAKKCYECSCEPNNTSIVTLKRSVIENLNIALTLKDITQVYLLNHQDCGAIRAFLGCANYPDFGQNNKKEIKINTFLLNYAKDYMIKKFPDKEYILCLIDINGTVATYFCKKWTVIYIGKFNNSDGLWYGLKLGEKY